LSDRIEQLHTWLRGVIGTSDYTFAPASSDASFRRYFRIEYGDNVRIVMDAPPEHENCLPYIKIAEALHSLGLHVPEIYAKDLDQGFMLISDLGNEQYLQVLNADNADTLYQDALNALLKLQTSSLDLALPPYDHAMLLREMEIFREWYLLAHLQRDLSDSEQKTLDESFEFLASAILEQPTVIVHRDYHSRNLLRTEENNPGILDFQDAVVGPVTYDVVSLLRDCYITWPVDKIMGWLEQYYHVLHETSVLQDCSLEQFRRWFDLTGTQRHLKATGIFARLNHRDNKPDYLGDIPRTLKYVEGVCEQYPELNGLKILLNNLDYDVQPINVKEN
jgi:aminoglycoside/choline kinase family phosphotransferase